MVILRRYLLGKTGSLIGISGRNKGAVRTGRKERTGRNWSVGRNMEVGIELWKIVGSLEGGDNYPEVRK